MLGLFFAVCGMIYGAKIVLEVWFTGIAVPGFPAYWSLSLFWAVSISLCWACSANMSGWR